MHSTCQAGSNSSRCASHSLGKDSVVGTLFSALLSSLTGLWKTSFQKQSRAKDFSHFKCNNLERD